MKPWLFQRGNRLQPIGEAVHTAKLTDECVESIRSAYRQRDQLRKHIRNNLTDDALAAKYGVTKRQIQRVVQGECWASSEATA